jgi:hypothetical protein
MRTGASREAGRESTRRGRRARYVVLGGTCVAALALPAPALAVKNVIVAQGGTATITQVDQLSDPGGTLTIDPDTIAAAPAGPLNSVVVAAENDITIADSIQVNPALGLTSIGFVAARSVIVDPGVQISGGAVGLAAGVTTIPPDPFSGNPGSTANPASRDAGPSDITMKPGSGVSAFFAGATIGTMSIYLPSAPTVPGGTITLGRVSASEATLGCVQTDCGGVVAPAAAAPHLVSPLGDLRLHLKLASGNVGSAQEPLAGDSGGMVNVDGDVAGDVHLHSDADLAVSSDTNNPLGQTDGIKSGGDVDLSSDGDLLVQDERSQLTDRATEASIIAGGDVRLQSGGRFTESNDVVPLIHAGGDVEIDAQNVLDLGNENPSADVLAGGHIHLTSHHQNITMGNGIVESNRAATPSAAGDIVVTTPTFVNSGYLGRVHARGTSAADGADVVFNADDGMFVHSLGPAVIESDFGAVRLNVRRILLEDNQAPSTAIKAPRVVIVNSVGTDIHLGPHTDDTTDVDNTELDQAELDLIDTPDLQLGAPDVDSGIVVSEPLTRPAAGAKLTLATKGAVTGAGSLSVDKLVIDRSQAPGATYTVGASSFRLGAGAPLGITTSDLDVKGGPGDDTFDALGAPAGRATTFAGGAGTDKIVADSSGSGAAGGNLDGFAAGVTFDGAGGDDSWTATDADAAAGHGYAVSSSGLKRDAQQILSLGEPASGSLTTSGHDDTVAVPSLALPLTLNTGDGQDDVTVGADVHSLDGVAAAVQLDGGAGGDSLTLDDAQAANAAAYEVRQQAIGRLGTLVTPTGVETRTILGTPFDDTLRVDADGPGPGETTGNAGAFTFDGNAGDDSATFSDRGGAFGAFWDVHNTEIDRSAPAVHASLPDVETRNVIGSGNGTTFYRVDATEAGTLTSLSGAGAPDSFAFSHLEDLAGRSQVDGGGGFDSVSLDDRDAPAAGTWTIKPREIKRAGVPQMPDVSEVTRVIITGSPFDDTFTVGEDGSLDNFTHEVRIIGDDGSDTATYDDSAQTDGQEYTVEASKLTRSGIAPFPYAGLEQVNLRTGSGDDDITRPIGDPLAVAVDAGTGADALTLDDTADTTGRQWAFTAGAVTREGAGPVTHSGVESLTADGGSGPDTFRAKGAPDVAYSFDAGDPSSAPGDTLEYDAEARATTRTAGTSGTITSAPMTDLAFADFEDVQLQNLPAPPPPTTGGQNPPAPAPPAAGGQGPPSPTPPAGCRSNRKLSVGITLAAPRGIKLRRTAVRVNGKVKRILGRGITRFTLDLNGYPTGVAMVILKATTTTGKTLVATRTYRLCGYTAKPPTRLTPLHTPGT